MEAFDSPLLAFDNSDLSLKLLDLVEQFKRSLSQLTILHVHNPEKVYIQARNKGGAVYDYLKERFPDKNNTNVRVELKAMGEKNTNTIILQSFVASQSTILFLGFVGSKGFKPRNNDLSSRIRKFVYETRLHLAIVKREDRGTGKLLFLLDGSTTSFEGLEAAVVFSKKMGKQLVVLHTFNQDQRGSVKFVKSQLKVAQQSQKDFKFQQILQQGELLTALSRVQADFDWVMMNRNGYRGSISKQKFVGHVTSEVLQNIDNNLIIMG